jgi:predicted HicB family RNase H-like nuclease
MWVSRYFGRTDRSPPQMRRSVHDRVINFRASSALVEAAAKRADEDGMSLAELLRANLREAVRRPESERR